MPQCAARARALFRYQRNVRIRMAWRIRAARGAARLDAVAQLPGLVQFPQELCAAPSARRFAPASGAASSLPETASFVSSVR